MYNIILKKKTNINLTIKKFYISSELKYIEIK